MLSDNIKNTSRHTSKQQKAMCVDHSQINIVRNIKTFKTLYKLQIIRIFIFRFENAREKTQNHEGKIKEENKYKRDPRNDRLQPKNAPLQGEPVSSNNTIILKYTY